MGIYGISNFHIPTINNPLDLSNLECAKVKVGNIPKPNKKMFMSL